MFRNLLVLCEGNHCRSPLAAALLAKALGDRGAGPFTVASAGLHALTGAPADAEITRLAREMGVDLDSHRGQNLEPGMALGADLIFVMDAPQKARLFDRLPATRGRVFLLGHWLRDGEQEIPDPFKRGPEAMAASARHIQAAVQAWMPRLLA